MAMYLECNALWLKIALSVHAYILTEAQYCSIAHLLLHRNIWAYQMSMIPNTDAYPQKALRKIKGVIYNHQADCQLYVDAVSDLVFCDPWSRVMSLEYPDWDSASNSLLKVTYCMLFCPCILFPIDWLPWLDLLLFLKFLYTGWEDLQQPGATSVRHLWQTGQSHAGKTCGNFFATLDRISKLEVELEQFKQALGSLYQEVHWIHEQSCKIHVYYWDWTYVVLHVNDINIWYMEMNYIY